MKIQAILLLFLCAAGSARAEDKIRIVATTTTLADFARHVTGEAAEIHAVASPKRDLHRAQPNPKDVLKVRKADVFIHNGLDTEPWRGPLLDAAGNPDFLGTGARSIDASPGIRLLEVPEVLSRAEGDIHQFGNPHVWSDPANGVLMLRNIAAGLARLYPEHAEIFLANAESYARKIEAELAEWEARLAPHRGLPIVTYHRSWPYFAARFGLEVVGQVEPHPGIPPTARHLASLVRTMKEKKAPLILKETYYDDRSAQKVAAEAGAKVVGLAQSVQEVEEASDYIAMIEYNVAQIENALEG